MSRSVIPAVFRAAITAVMARALASLASRAVLPSVVTPLEISAISGGADTFASPVTEMLRGGIVCAFAGAANVSASRASAATSALLERNVNIDGELVFGSLERIGDIFLDEHVLCLELLVVEVIGDRFIGVVHVVVGATMGELQRLAFRRLPHGQSLRQIFGRFLDRHLRLERKSGVVGRRVDDLRVS